MFFMEKQQENFFCASLINTYVYFNFYDKLFLIHTNKDNAVKIKIVVRQVDIILYLLFVPFKINGNYIYMIFNFYY